MTTEEIMDSANLAIKGFQSAMLKTAISTYEATQSMAKFSETYKALENRYHPFVRWLYKIGVL